MAIVFNTYLHIYLYLNANSLETVKESQKNWNIHFDFTGLLVLYL
jgi:hypothetical protein